MFNFFKSCFSKSRVIMITSEKNAASPLTPTRADRKIPHGSLRIVHVVSSLNVGGMEHFALRIAAAQRQAGHDSSVLALQGGPLEDEACKLGLPVAVLGGRNKVQRGLRGVAAFLRLRPQIINSHNETSLQYGVLGKKTSRGRLVMTNHGQGAARPHDPHRREWSLTDAIITVSSAVAQRMDGPRLGRKISVIHNGVEFKPASRPRPEVRTALGIDDNRVVGCIVARIDALKGHDTLLQALALLKQRGTPVTVFIAGDGAERRQRETLAGELGLGGDDVRFLGFRSDVPDLLAASDFFLLPSLTEGLPLSILEAMSHGLPTVATDVGGIPELITDNRHGFLVPVGDPVALAAAMEKIIRNGELRRTFGDAASQRVRDQFSFTRMAHEYEILYRRLLQPQKGVAN